MKLLPVRLVLAAGAAEVHLRRRFPRLMWVVVPRSGAPSDEPFAQLQRIEAELAYNELFFGGRAP
ncbi:hypothetical protein [Streptomyces tsukubensis]|uniref:Uncharacterized protein n=1 Tax=Streptomyces tsukubensis TaxID=83656 RepID=A0A1V4A4Q3_9ACTN|nr:hypothetical protein [Streptomyces tsukubensis]OON74878.1 hypothetical protein B1H18_23900 [Streptomyces tsukubensis]QFR94807.1 hypothetical protein GBW32_19415 [Streptomyces tsukubensis]